MGNKRKQQSKKTVPLKTYFKGTVDGRKEKALIETDLVIRVSSGRNEAKGRQDKLYKRDMSLYPQVEAACFFTTLESINRTYDITSERIVILISTTMRTPNVTHFSSVSF
jgi:hypothetical protein